MKNRLFPTNALPLWKLLGLTSSTKSIVCPVRPTVLSKSAKSLVQLGNTFTQSGGGCLKKCLQLSLLLPLPSNKLHTFPKIHKKKKQEGLSSSAKSLIQLWNTFTQSGCGCLKKCLQLSILLPLPSHKLHTFPKIQQGTTLLEKLRAADKS